MFLTRRFFYPFSKVGDDTRNTGNFIICRKIAIFKIDLVKCCSLDEFFTHFPISAMILERPVILSFAVKLPYSKYSLVNVANQMNF